MFCLHNQHAGNTWPLSRGLPSIHRSSEGDDECLQGRDIESWKASESLSSEKRALWLLSGCRSVSSDEGEPQPKRFGSACRWESDCCNAVATFLETAMKKRWTLAALSAEDDASSSISLREDSDSDGDSSDDDVPLRSLIRSKPSLAGFMVSATTSEIEVRYFLPKMPSLNRV